MGFLSQESHLNFVYKLLLECVCEVSTSLKLGNLLGSNLDLLLCCRVDTLTSGALANTESTETNEGNLVTCYESILNGCNRCVKSFLCINL